MTAFWHELRDDLEGALAKLESAIAELEERGKMQREPRGLADPAAFFNHVRSRPPLGPSLTTDEVDGCERLLNAFEGWPTSWAAYGLATGYHETAGTLKPIREYGKGRGYRYGVEVPPGSGLVYYGRGDVQLTWDYNYKKAGEKLGVNLLGEPDLALDPVISADIMKLGMEEGWFTGKKLADYLPPEATREQFAQARRIVNGTDRADLIASYAVTFQEALKAGRWV